MQSHQVGHPVRRQARGQLGIVRIHAEPRTVQPDLRMAAAQDRQRGKEVRVAFHRMPSGQLHETPAPLTPAEQLRSQYRVRDPGAVADQTRRNAVAGLDRVFEGGRRAGHHGEPLAEPGYGFTDQTADMHGTDFGHREPTERTDQIGLRQMRMDQFDPAPEDQLPQHPDGPPGQHIPFLHPDVADRVQARREPLGECTGRHQNQEVHFVVGVPLPGQAFDEGLRAAGLRIIDHMQNPHYPRSQL